MATLISILDVPTIDRDTIARKLKQAGWLEAAGKSADPTFTHPEVNDEHQARERLRGMGLDPQDFYIEADTDARAQT